ncbi:hypothetical protein WA026_015525 [Henosepilachna vigintioctopunctata]|uniref:Uncharacterized protein n=1 Tax=Henosepilachna vigintioctopunctata TaxID=420089 RepID=A0AAW1VA28_9CUCU
MLRRLPSRFIPNFVYMDATHKIVPSRKRRNVHIADKLNEPAPPRRLRRKYKKGKTRLSSEKKKNRKNGHIEEISKVIKKFMLHYNLPPPTVNHLIEKINSIVKSLVNNEITKLSEQYEQEKSILKAEYMNKEGEFKQKLSQVDNFLNVETKRIEKEHKKLIYLTENMVLNEKKLSDKSREMEGKVKRINELEMKLAQELENCVRKNCPSPLQSPLPQKLCEMKHCDKICEENRKEIELLRIQKQGFEKIAENQNVLIANLTAKSNVMYKQLQEGMYTIEQLRSQLIAQNKLLENERRRELSERTMSSSEGLTVGTDGEGDHNIDDVIKENHLKLDELDKKSIEIERRFKYFQSSLRRQ